MSKHICEEQRLRQLIPLVDSELALFLIQSRFQFAFDGRQIVIPYEVLLQSSHIFQAQFVGVTAQELRDAIDSSPQAPTLTDATVEQLQNYQRYKVLIAGEDVGIYYGISPENELAGLVNNGPLRGIGARIAVPQAIKQGARKLNAWNVGGKLQVLYSIFGFQVVEHIPYDVRVYGEPPPELKKAWRASGWTDVQPYPVVTYMELDCFARSIQ